MNNLKSFWVFSILNENNDIGSDLDDLISGFQNLGISMTDEEIQMEKFVEQFGGGKNPSEWAEYLFDYYHNPEEYFIEKDSEYHEQICQFYEDSVEPHKRFNLNGPMRFGNFQRFELDSIEETPEYKLYRKMSSKNR
jgi:hypothetical protein